MQKVFEPPYFTTDFNQRQYAEAFVGPMTDKEYALYVYRGKWQNAMHLFRGKIPNDFKSKK